MSLLPQAGISGEGQYNIEDSLRFRSSASAYLNWTPSSNGNRQIFTFSAWVKRGKLGAENVIFHAGTASTNRGHLRFNSNDTCEWAYYNGSWILWLQTTAVFRDPSAWYHIVGRCNTTNGTSNLYINGVDQTSLSQNSKPSGSQSTSFGQTVEHQLGQRGFGDAGYLDGYVTEANFIDGQALTADDFGQYDANGTWKAKRYTGTYGTNGFYLPMKPTTQADGFNTVTFSADGTGSSVSGFGFTPDFIWAKNRTSAYNHELWDTVRGTGSELQSNSAAAEITDSNRLISFDSGGFTYGTGSNLYVNSTDSVAWAWDAGDNQPSTGHSSVLYKASTVDGTYDIKGFGFNPDLLWIKNRNNTENHYLFDTVRGVAINKGLLSNSTAAEGVHVTSGTTISMIDDGFRIVESSINSGEVYFNSRTYVAWGWDAGDGDPVSNTTGDITSTVKANDATGFSIVSYTGNGTNGATVGHGLSTTPSAVIVKDRNNTNNWAVYHKDLTSTSHSLVLNSTSAEVNYGSSFIAPAASTLSLANGSQLNASSRAYIAYCFSEVSGVSKFGSYSGTGSSGNAITTGFRPGFVMIKRTDTTGNWILLDSTRDPFNSVDSSLVADLTNAETANNAAVAIDFNSNGFTIQGTGNGVNNSSGTYIYMAFKGSYSDYVSPLNTDGTIDSRVKANPSKGFSIVSYTGTGANATVGHGLGVAPSMMIVKNRDSAGSWAVYHANANASPASGRLYLQVTNAFTAQATAWNSTVPSSTVFSVGSLTDTNQNTNAMIAYCFAEVAGYSDFGSYTGTGSAGNSVTGLGFQPAWLMIKETTSTGNWAIIDTTRSPNYDAQGQYLWANLSQATGGASAPLTFDSDGFTINSSDSDTNTSGQTYIYMAFADTRDAKFNFDASGNKNNWLPNNINSSGESETTYDLMKDTPSLVDENAANFATLNPLQRANGTLSNGNLSFVSATLRTSPFIGTISVDVTDTDGYWYEVIPTQGGVTNYYIGFAEDGYEPYNASASTDAGFLGFLSNGHTADEGTYLGTDSSAAWVNGDVVGIGVKSGGIYVSINGVPANSGNPLITGKTGSWKPWLSHVGSSTTTFNGSINFGQQPFKYTPPTGFKKYNTFNLPDSTIEDGSDYFNTVLYTGDNTSNRNIPTGFPGGWTWIKNRNLGNSHTLSDVVRGDGKTLFTNSTNVEVDYGANGIDFVSDGFDVTHNATNNLFNVSGRTYVAWNWKANGSGVSNTDGSITSTVSVNTTAGFSIVSYTGSGSTSTVGHGLGVAPNVIIWKGRNYSINWAVYHSSIGAGAKVYLDLTNASAADTTYMNNTAPTSTVFSIASNAWTNNSAAATLIAYCFAEVEGFSKFGSYTGNGSTNGPFIYTGFRPAWIMIKRTDSSVGGNWQIQDSSRTPFNWTCNALFADSSSAENTSEVESTYGRDYLSNGFKIRSSHTSHNTNTATYIYMAFAENPFKNALAR